MARTPFALLLIPALCLAACASPAEPTKRTGTASTSAKPKPMPKGAPLTGTAMAPSGMVAAGAGNMVAAGAGNMVAAGAGNMVAAGAGNYALTAVDEKPLAGAGVWLVPADEKGEVPTRDPDAVTDAKGNFSLPVAKKSDTGAYAVIVGAKTAEGKDASLQTIVAAEPGGKTAKVGAASTVAAANLRAKGKAALAGFDAGRFALLIDAFAAELETGNLPDFSDVKSILAKADALVAGSAVLAKAAEDAAAGVQAAGDKVADEGKKLEDKAQACADLAKTNPIAAVGCLGN